MSIHFRQNDVARIQRDLANIRNQDAAESRKDAAKTRELVQASRSLNSTRNESSANSYQQQIVRATEELSRIQGKRADLAKKAADKLEQLHRAGRSLEQEQERERNKLVEAEKKREREQLNHQRRISQELVRQRTFSRISDFSVGSLSQRKSHDAFISHASEDKEEFVRPLAEALHEAGFSVWYDVFSLKIGDSLRRSIDRGLADSRYGIVVLSSAFFEKNWPQYELDGLIAK